MMDIHGIGPAGAARILADVGDIARFPDRGHFASWTGTAPIDASSGDNIRHRLSRGGNRQFNMALHMMAVVQLRNLTEGRALLRPQGRHREDPNEAMRALERRLADVVCKIMLNDLIAARDGPGRTPGKRL